MLFLNFINIMFLLVGVIVGYIMCVLFSNDVCEHCEYQELFDEFMQEGYDVNE